MIERRGFLASCLAVLVAPLAWFRVEKPEFEFRIVGSLDGKNTDPFGPILIRRFPSGRVSVSSNGEEWKAEKTELPWLVYRLDNRGGVRFCWWCAIMPVYVDWWFLSAVEIREVPSAPLEKWYFSRVSDANDWEVDLS